MLLITVDDTEFFDAQKQEFVYIKRQTLSLEHSLVSLAKWEAKWHKPFLSQEPKTEEELIDYIRCMTITQNVNPLVYAGLTDAHFKAIQDYMDDPMTATTIHRRGKSQKKEIITAEIIYYWMIALNIPIEFQKWHLNRLLMLVDVVSLKSNPEKMSKNEIYKSNRELNAARRKKLNTKG